VTEVQELIEKEFNQLKPKKVSPVMNPQASIEDLQEELALYRESSKQLGKGYDGLRSVIFKALLRHQLKLSDIPQELRLSSLDVDGYFSVAAHRYASDSGDIAYLTEILSTMYEDAVYGVTSGIIHHREFHELICSWLNYFDYDKIEFKGDDDFERYFQEQKERHRDFFKAFGL